MKTRTLKRTAIVLFGINIFIALIILLIKDSSPITSFALLLVNILILIFTIGFAMIFIVKKKNIQITRKQEPTKSFKEMYLEEKRKG